ncbi:hypothetical protein GQ44DRAFT_785142 [Phaeosphaeriaceae sp. PMI808]|nr:hypothetical protein GQ44DRAFT_785142 [Phaeosphaeriaceae sp. PMI808]
MENNIQAKEPIQPKDVQRPIPDERFNAKSFYSESGLCHGNSNVLHAYTLSENFFSINPVEASAMDPQQRLLLETVYEAVESAGLKTSNLQDTNVEVYVGFMCNDYEAMLLRDLDTMPTYHATGIGRSIVSNRISYFFDWTGPSMAIDTACSSSLITLHEAVQLLRQGQTKVAVAAGTNLILGFENFIGESKLKMLSPTGRSRMWDAEADGYARGEGVAAVILKPLSATIADGDNIECIVRETGTNQDGRSKGITHLSSTAQASLIREVYRNADRPQFFEAHGTGTPAGDPIEAAAISSAFFPKGRQPSDQSLYCGSIKTVIGHTEGTAGLAAVIKAALALKHAKIPPNLLFKRLNPDLQSSYQNLKVPTELLDWPKTSGSDPRRASINSFGFGGANAHAILESFNAPSGKASLTKDPARFTPYVFSAASEYSLREMAKQYVHYLHRNPDVSLNRLGFTLDQKRSIHSYRMAITAPTNQILAQKLEETIKGQLPPPASRISTQPAILGVFTGQGAQWPTMGRQLLRQSHKAWSILQNLQRVLSNLPDAPKWNLTEEILAEGPKSGIKEAEISQPACTAIQIVLVDLLQAGGIRFKAVLGHSSGKITAAYAAGHMSAEAAIITAYYRGKHARLAAGQDGETEDAEELCSLPDFRGRVTISVVFEDEEKMAKLLFVDKAYHSHHMNRCSDATGFSFHKQTVENCLWVSSVYNKAASHVSDRLTSEHWNENMVQPVLFSQAIETAYRLAGPFDLAIEIGPHPALKRPVIETYEAVHGSQLPYTALLQRGKDDVEAFSEGLGRLWELFGDAPGLRGRTSPTHELLGNILPDGTDQVLRWRNYMSVREMPWLEGHKLQEQTIFPAAGYVSMALEATKALSPDRSRKLLEVRDLKIQQAMAFQDDNSDVETLFTLFNICHFGLDTITASFTIESTVGKSASKLTATACGSIFIEFGESEDNLLPARVDTKSNLIPVPTDRFYESLSEIGYHYTSTFKGLSELSRNNGHAQGLILNQPSLNSQRDYLLIHPATLDLAIQAIILAHSYPQDGQLFAIHVPVQVDCIRLDVGLCASLLSQNIELPFVASTYQSNNSICGDVDLYTTNAGLGAMVQVEGIKCVLFSEATEKDDAQMFSTTEWAAEIPNSMNYEYALALDLERVLVPEDNHGWRTVYQGMFRFMCHIRSRPEWSSDTEETISRLRKKHPASLDFRIIDVTTILEHLMQDNLLNDYYAQAMAIPNYTTYLARMVAQLVHRYPHMRILEIGAGTGGATKGIFREIGSKFAEYTFTDISSGFFDKAQEVFQSTATKMKFSTLNVENDPSEQGFEKNSYDLIVASLVLHATKELRQTLLNVRQLLKPGGFLLMFEMTDNEPMRTGFIFGALPQWWSGAEDGRVLSPCIEPLEWHRLLCETGFSGIDAVTSDLDRLPHPASVMLSQAVDNTITALREPMITAEDKIFEPIKTLDLAIVGGDKLGTCILASQIAKILSSKFKSVISIPTLKFLAASNIDKSTVILSIIDLDCLAFAQMDHDEFESLKTVFENSFCVIWYTSGSRADNPHANMIRGFGRSLMWELPELRVPFLDLETLDPDPTTIAHRTLQFCLENKMQDAGTLKSSLWSIEPEIVLQQQKTLIPRIKPNHEMNARYNSKRRNILAKTDPRQDCLVIRYSPSGYTLEQSHSINKCISTTTLRLDSGISAFLVFGRVASSGEWVFGLSQINASKVVLKAEFITKVGGTQITETEFSHLLTAIILQRILIRTISGATLLIHGSDDRLAQKQVKCLLTTTDTSKAANPSWKTNSYCTCFEEIPPTGLRNPLIKQLLNQGLSIARDVRINGNTVVPSNPIKITELSKVSTSYDPSTTISWEISEGQICNAVVRSFDSERLFHSDKTYWLVGLTGDLGLSLCAYMHEKGAKHIVISSRNPKVDGNWLAEIKSRGANLKIVSCDVTNYESVSKACEDICEDMPPIAGIVQGAMVLHETPVRDMTFELLQKVLRPKVQGSINLNRLSMRLDLDFFIYFSSMTGVVGNIGQASYTTANAFMMSQAAQRRKSGLCGSVINIGAIIGVGQDNQNNLFKGGYVFMSEQAYHQAFSEAVIAEISTGLRQVNLADSTLPVCVDNPRFSHHESEQIVGGDALPIGARLRSCTTPADLQVVIFDAFTLKLCSLLRMEMDISEDKEKIMAKRTDDFGIDSLVAVEIRTWFLKTLGVNVPVLKILGGAAVEEIVQYAAERLDPSFVPNMGKAGVVSPSRSKAPITKSKAPVSKASPTPKASSTAMASKPSAQVQGQEKSLSSSSSDDEFTDSLRSTPSSSPSSNGYSQNKTMQATGTEQVRRAQEIRSGSLSYAQEMFFFVHHFAQDRTTLNHTGSLKYAVQAIGDHHEAIRTSYLYDADKRPIQSVLDKSPLRLELVRIADEAELCKHEYDIENGQTIRNSYFFVDGVTFKQRSHFDRGLMNTDLDFWKSEFKTIPTPLPILSLPGDKERRSLTNYEFSRAKIELDAEVVSSIKTVCKQLRVTPFHFHLSVFQVLLARFMDAEDICIGLGDANRTSDESMEAIGAYVNLVPLRLSINRKDRFLDVILQSRKKVLEGLSHAQVPFGLLLNELNIPRSDSASPLFQAFIDYRLGHKQHERFADCQLEFLEFEQGRTGYDTGRGCTMDLMLQKALYTEEDAQILSDSYRALDSQISEVIGLGTGPVMRSEWPEFPYNVAMSTRVISGSRVGVFQHPTADWICSLLAIWTLGAVYIPLDLSTPIPRLAKMVQDSSPSVVLTSEDTLEFVDDVVGDWILTINVDNISTSWNRAVGGQTSSKSVCAIFYTSGSTGTPKGISLTTENIRDEIEFAAESYGIGRERVLQQSSLGFDMSLTQVFSALAFGGSLHMLALHARGDPSAIVNVMTKAQISMTGGTPSEYQSWIQYLNLQKDNAFQSWRIAVSGGEQVTQSLLVSFDSLDNSDLRLYNAYGPTEATCSSHRMKLDYRNHASVYASGRIPVGHDQGRVLPIGMPGEIAIGGPGIASGYLNHDDLTQKRFINNPYQSSFSRSNDWTTIHKTGDKGRLLSDGKLVVEGRIDGDTQVKLSGGLRVDLLDIENTILHSSEGQINVAVVSLYKENDQPEIITLHAVCSPQIPLSGQRDYIQQLIRTLPLPQYMRPTFVEVVDHIPRKSSGKINRKAVLSLIKVPTKTGNISARAELLKVWRSILPQQVLGDRKAEPSTSMLLITLRHRIQETFGVELALVDMFKASALSDMALLIEENSRNTKQTSIDWNTEIALPNFDSTIWHDKGIRSPPRSLLEMLLSDGRIQTVHCIAGDLTLPNFVYSTLKQANTTSTLQLLQLIPIHFISTAGIALWSGLDVFGERSAAQWEPPTNGFDGYTATKWASERLLEKVCLAYGLPITIHRPSNISREGQAPDMDLFQNLLRYCYDLNAVPHSPNLTGTLNLVTINECSGMIIDSLFAPNVEGQPQYVNEIGSTNLDLESLGAFVQGAGKTGMQVENIELGRWIDLAEHAGLNPAVAAFFGRVERDTASRVRYPKLIRGPN